MINYLSTKALLVFSLLSFYIAGAATIIILERFDKIPTSCIISQDAFDYLQEQEPLPKKR